MCLLLAGNRLDVFQCRYRTLLNGLGALSYVPLRVHCYFLSQMSVGPLMRTPSVDMAQGSQRLLIAIEEHSVDDVRRVLEEVLRQGWSVLTEPSLVAKHGQRTPFMAAAKRGDLPIFTAVLNYFNRLFPDKVRAARAEF